MGTANNAKTYIGFTNTGDGGAAAKKAAEEAARKADAAAAAKKTAADNAASKSYVDSMLAKISDSQKAQEDIAMSKVVMGPGPSLMDIGSLAGKYGITYDADSIYNTLKQGVDAQANTLYGKQKQSEGLYYDNAHTAQNTLMDSLNQVQSQAVGSGVNKGMQAANLLSTALGVSNQFAQQATALSQERSNIANTVGEALAGAKKTAEQASFDRRNAIAELARQVYAADIQKYTADATLYGDIDTNNAARQQANLNADVAYNQLMAEALTSLANTKYTSNTTLKATQAQAKATTDAAKLSSNAQIRAAQLAAEANKYSASQNYLGQKAYADAYGSAASQSAGASTAMDAAILSALQAGTIASEVPLYQYGYFGGQPVQGYTLTPERQEAKKQEAAEASKKKAAEAEAAKQKAIEEAKKYNPNTQKEVKVVNGGAITVNKKK